MTASHVCFIDESGDEGLARGSRWFVLGGVVCRTGDIGQVDALVNAIKSDVGNNGTQVLHFRNLHHTNRKQAATRLGSLSCVGVICVVSDTNNVPPPAPQWSPNRPRNWLYHYLTRYLLERAVRLVRGSGGTDLDVVMSNRSSLKYADLQAYLARLGPDLAPVVSLRPVQPAQSLGLQLADVAASSAFFAFEPDRFGSREEAYLRAIAGCLYRGNGVLVGNGVKFMGTAAAQSRIVDSEFPWLRSL